MPKWKVKTTEPTTTISSVNDGIKFTGYNTIDVEAEGIDISESMIIFYKKVPVEKQVGTKIVLEDTKIALAAFSVRNIISVIRIDDNKEKCNEQTSETSV